MDKPKIALGAIGLGGGTVAAISYGVVPDHALSFLSEAASHQVTQNLFYFALAAWIHSGRVRKEIRFLTQSISDLGAALRQDFSALSNRVGNVEENVAKIIERERKRE